MLSCHLLYSINGCLVYYMRFNLRLAHGDYLEQRQACHCHPCVLHPCLRRYIKRVSQDCRSVLIWAYRSDSFAGIGGCAILIRGLFIGKFYSVLFTAPILVTSLLSTGLFAWKAWCVLNASDPRQLSLTTMSLM